MMREVRLYGALRKFGRSFWFDVNSPKEAVNALCAQIEGFEKFLRTAEERGLVFAVFSGKRNLSEAETEMISDDDQVIRIAPIIMGSKQQGLFQVVLGVALVAIGYFTFGVTTSMGMGLIAAGVGIGISGAITMLTPVPKAGDVREEDGNNPSKNFNGPVTTTAQGHPYPKLYGECFVGGAVINAGIYPEDRM